jgi:hypothetical protein
MEILKLHVTGVHAKLLAPSREAANPSDDIVPPSNLDLNLIKVLGFFSPPAFPEIINNPSPKLKSHPLARGVLLVIVLNPLNSRVSNEKLVEAGTPQSHRHSLRGTHHKSFERIHGADTGG